MRKNEVRLNDLLGALSRDPRYKGKLYQKKIESSWKTMMGVWIDRETRSIRVRDGVLSIRISSAALREELDMMKEKLREKVNDALGEEYIREVVVR